MIVWMTWFKRIHTIIYVLRWEDGWKNGMSPSIVWLVFWKEWDMIGKYVN